MDELAACFAPYGLQGGALTAEVVLVLACDGVGVAFVLVLGFQEPLVVLLVLHTEFLELAVEGLRPPAELFGYLGDGVGALTCEDFLIILYLRCLLLDDALLFLGFGFEELFLGFGLFQAAVEDFHCVGDGGIVVAGGGYAGGEEFFYLCIYPHGKLGR